MALARITDHGATGDGVTNDAGAFTAAATAAGNGGVVIVPTPAVSYRCKSIPVSKSVRFIGEGNRPLIERYTPGGNSTGIFNCSVGNVSWENLAFDVRATPSSNFAFAIGAVDLENFRVSDCYLYTSDDPALVIGPSGQAGVYVTIHALYFSGCRNVVVEDNDGWGVQFKMSGGSAGVVTGPGVRVRNNFLENCHNFGMSWVSVFDSAYMQECIIEGNHFLDCDSGGIFLGSDGDEDIGGRMVRLTCVHNHVSVKGLNGIGIVARAGEVAEDWDFSHNTIWWSGAEGGMMPLGIDVRTTDTERALKRCTVMGNRVTGCDLESIRLALGNDTDMTVIGNITAGGRGIRATSYGAGARIAVHGNITRPRGSQDGFRLTTSGASATLSAKVSGNHFGNGQTITESVPGNITLVQDDGTVIVAPGESDFYVDGVGYALAGVDWGAEVAAQIDALALDTAAWHRFMFRGEYPSNTQLDLSGFTAPCDVDAVGLRILWSGGATPPLVKNADTKVFGGRYRRDDESIDRPLVASSVSPSGVLTVTGVDSSGNLTGSSSGGSIS